MEETKYLISSGCNDGTVSTVLEVFYRPMDIPSYLDCSL